MDEPKIRRLSSQLNIALDIWEGIENTPYPADRWLGTYFHKHRKKIGSRDRRFLSETIYGLFRNKAFLTLWADPTRYSDSTAMLILFSTALEGLVSQQEFLDLASTTRNRESMSAEVYEQIRAFTFPKGARPEKNTERLALRYSYPAWLVERWEKMWGHGRVQQLLEVFEKRPLLTVRANTLKITREDLLSQLREKGYLVYPAALSPWGIVFEERIGLFDLEEFREGLLEVQDAGSQMVCRAVNPSPADTLWDVCAGGGGKSLLLSAMMQNKGRIVATDIQAWKLKELKKRAKRAGAFNIFPADIQRMKDIRSASSGYDKVLVDAPCSGTGTFRRNPDAKWKLSEKRFEEQQLMQMNILDRAVPLLKKGGRLYYVTCSVDRTENEDILEALFAKYPDLKPVEDIGFGEPSGKGRRLWPSEENDGFFMGAAEKR